MISSMFRRLSPSANGRTLADRIRKISENRIKEPVAHRAHATRAPRIPTFKDATLVLSTGNVRVIVTNVSATGVRIEFSARVELSDHALLVAPNLNLRRRTLVTWQREGCAGLTFTDSSDD